MDFFSDTVVPLPTGKYLQKVSEALMRFDPEDDSFLNGFQAQLLPLDEERTIYAYDMYDDVIHDWLDPSMWGFYFDRRKRRWVLPTDMVFTYTDEMRKICERAADKKPAFERALLGNQEDHSVRRRHIVRWKAHVPSRILPRMPSIRTSEEREFYLAFKNGRPNKDDWFDVKDASRFSKLLRNRRLGITEEEPEEEKKVQFLCRGPPRLTLALPSQMNLKHKQVKGLGFGLQSEETENLSIGSLSSFLDIPSALKSEEHDDTVHSINMKQKEPTAPSPLEKSQTRMQVDVVDEQSLAQTQTQADTVDDDDSADFDYYAYSPCDGGGRQYQDSGYAVKYPQWRWNEFPSSQSEPEVVYGHFTSPLSDG